MKRVPSAIGQRLKRNHLSDVGTRRGRLRLFSLEEPVLDRELPRGHANKLLDGPRNQRAHDPMERSLPHGLLTASEDFRHLWLTAVLLDERVNFA